VYKGPKGLRARVSDQEEKINPDEARTMTLEGMDRYKFHVGRYGAYVTTQRDGEDVSASLPDNESPADITPEVAEKLIDQKIHGADALGKDPQTGLSVYVLNGRYGPYVQLGDVTPEFDKPKRASLPPGTQPEQVDLKMALELLSLPKTLGKHPGTGKEIKAGLGRFGPFVVHEGDYRSIPKGESIFTITLERALEMLNQPKKGRGRAAPLKELGAHPESGEAIQVFNGPYGPYIKSGKVNVSLPEGTTPDTVTLEQAAALITEKGGSKGKAKSKGGGKGSTAKAPKKATAAEKPAVAKKALKKASSAKEKAEILGVKKVVTRKAKK
ncbi:MAG: topoisomerase C-terminal repeat-containing protein, partial [Bdellovibrio sp.]